MATSPAHASLIGEIDSAGTGAYHSGDPPDSRTMSTLRRHGIRNYQHAARQVTRDDFRTFDYLLAMDKQNLRDLLDLRESVIASAGGAGAGAKRGGAKGRAVAAAAVDGIDAKIAQVRLFGDYGVGGAIHERVGGGEVVQDPYYGGASGFEDVYQQAVRFSQNFLDHLRLKEGEN
ncbi:hypothetical protein ASPZODRAFT_130832, partial [Penicilliopsis zonata CBS 506.65]